MTTREYLDVFQGAMTGFLLIILGNFGAPLNMAVWFAQADRDRDWIRLQEA
jgi:hypothetical protein